jgi:hypothetical protein
LAARDSRADRLVKGLTSFTIVGLTFGVGVGAGPFAVLCAALWHGVLLLVTVATVARSLDVHARQRQSC